MSQTSLNLEDPAKSEELRVKSTIETRLQPSHVNGTPTIFFMGLQRSGKTSAAHVLFHDLPSANTLHLEPTLTPKKYVWESFINVNILELPADHPSLDPNHPCNADLGSSFANITTILWFVDSQDEYMDSLERLHIYIMDILPHKPSINFEIFIHKCDALSDDFRHDIYRDIEMRMMEDLADSQVFSALMNFSQTSVYDKTLHDAFSRVLQKVIPELPTLASLLDSLCANSNYIKAYLFDTRSNLYVASDTTPGSLSIYESCADYLDMISEFSAIYGWMSSQPGGGSIPGENGVVTESLVTMEKGVGASGMCCREINKHLTLVAMLANEGPGKAKPMMDWNMGVVCKSVGKVLDMTMGRAREYREREGPYVSEEERVKIPAGRGRRMRG